MGADVSADNWTRCPHCVESARAANEKRLSDLAATYGVTPHEEWTAAYNEASVPFSTYDLKETVREDWEIGLPYEADEKEATIIYSARCTECGASAKLRTTVPFERAS